jgi:hypothetical protein
MRKKTKWSAGLMGSVLLAGAALAVPAGSARASVDPQSIEICSYGNYTSYAKVVGGGLDQDETHVPAGSCFTDYLQVSGFVTIYLFGIYNTSHVGFEIGYCQADPFSWARFYTSGITTNPSSEYQELSGSNVYCDLPA